MKLTGARWQGFIRQPDPGTIAVLLFGTEPGMVQTRAKELATIWLAGNDDPFALTRLTAEDLGGKGERLVEAACQASLLGGARVVHVSGATDALTPTVIETIESPSCIARIVIEAGNLTPRSKLRQAFEQGKTLAATGCYPLEGRALGEHIARRLGEREIKLSPETVDFIAGRLNDHLGQIDQELEKLALLAGPGGVLDADLVALGLGDASEAAIDALTRAIGGGDIGTTEQALRRLFAAGQSAIGLLRVALRHLARLHQARCRLEDGDPAEKAAASLTPPVLPRQRGEFARQINLLNRSDLEMMIDILTRAERACKRTGMPAEAVAGQSLLAACRIPARNARRHAAAFD